MASIENQRFLTGLARAASGSLLFSLPMLLTMEMWSLGATADPVRMGVLHLMTLPTLFGLAKFSGFEEPIGVVGTLVDALVAYAVGWSVSVLILLVMSLINFREMAFGEIFGVIAIQTVPASIGAVLAASQLGNRDESETSEDSNADDDSDASVYSTKAYFRELFIMAAGALFLALNVAPTEEMVLIAYRMTAWHALVLSFASIAVMHAFVFAVKFRGQEAIPEDHSAWSVFLRFTIPGYAIALLVSLFCLWSFGSTTETGAEEVAMASAVLGLPAAVGASAARLIL